MKSKKFINFLFLLSVIFIVCLTLYPNSSFGTGEIDKGEKNLIPFHTILRILKSDSLYKAIVNIIGNVFLFVPTGFILPIKFKKLNSLFKTALIGLFISILIEYIQLFIPHRWTDIDDVILNTTGTIIGYKLFCFYVKSLTGFESITWTQKS
ncbi:VanZ family protein [Priestia aryabhattai]|uniref:VanZ family protein n=1 Tax=Priestia aryabhattai TaxID=412384 RepID=UPI002041B0ED|nr:VanZ family protein [Priestia aryabhattai]MCM3253622.1 VanZ family protein [Priestia aryabhattai]